MLVDTHVHVVSHDQDRYPRSPNQAGLSWVDEHACSTEEFVALMDENGIDQAVLVQALGAYTADNRYCVDSANAFPDRFASVVYVDLTGPDPAAEVARLASEGAVGVRVVTGTGAAAFGMGDAIVADVWERALGSGMCILATTLAPELPRLPMLLERFPDAPVAIDHCAFPDLTGGPPYPNARPLFELASFPNVHVKVSTNSLDQARLVGGDPRDFVAALAEAYGPRRLQWGSDWSQTNDRPFGELVAYAHEAFSVLSEADRRWAYGDAARAFWPGLAES